jgi:perosamine synthetase
MIPISEPQIRGREWEYIKDCLETGWVSSVGSYVDRFESDIASYIGVKHAVATSSGTAALHLALLVAGIGEDDEVLVSNLTFIATANAVRYTGAHPILVDAESEYLQIDVQKVKDFLRSECYCRKNKVYNKKTHRQVKAILPVHILGHPVDIAPLLQLADEYGLLVIEDATEGLGARYEGKLLGGDGDMGCFSFNGNKIITTGGGGMIVTNNDEWAKRARHLSTQAKSDPVEYIHDEMGYNYRLTNIQAAMGCAQLECLDEFICKKRSIAVGYAEGLKGVPGLRLMGEAESAFSTYWLCSLLLDSKYSNATSRELLSLLRSRNIQSRPIWQPLHMSKVYGNCQSTDCSVSELLYEQALSIPCSVNLAGDRQAEVIDAILEGLSLSR